jgi:hypothetical protein
MVDVYVFDRIHTETLPREGKILLPLQCRWLNVVSCCLNECELQAKVWTADSLLLVFAGLWLAHCLSWQQTT